MKSLEDEILEFLEREVEPRRRHVSNIAEFLNNGYLRTRFLIQKLEREGKVYVFRNEVVELRKRLQVDVPTNNI